ncbi:unnamed protein product [Schistosoma rodhaini]|nr:unnamed protein product [Schistosoma rodhaini]
MVKSKKDFQKVRVKVGRKLKCHNETVINLQKKRIILPKEREISKIQGDGTNVQIFESSIHSLNIEDSALRQSALRALNRLLDPLAKGITTIPFLDKNVLSLSSNFIPKVVDGQQKLLGSTVNTGCDIQIGNLIFVLGRFCRRVDDPRFCHEICQLFVKIVHIAYTHPKISDIIFELDQVVLNLLHRNELVWKFFGCHLSAYTFGLHCRLIMTMSILYQPSNRKKSVYSGVFDSLQQSIRFRAYSHLIIQCYNNLRQNRTFKTLSKYRAYLVRTTMVYLKDNQYTVSLSYSQSHHPWLYCLPYFSNQYIQLYISLKGYYLKELIDFHPTSRTFDSGLFSVVKQSLPFPSSIKNVVNNKHSQHKRNEKNQRSSTSGKISDNSSVVYIPTWCQEDYDDQVMIHGLIGEGLVLLDELNENPNGEVLSSLYYLLRALRVVFETKEVSFFTSHSSMKHDYSGWRLDVNEISPDLSTSLERFLDKFYSIYPLQLSPDSLSLMYIKCNKQKSQKSLNNQIGNYAFLLNSSNGQKSVNLTSKQFKQERKRRNKQLKRQLKNAINAGVTGDNNNNNNIDNVDDHDDSTVIDDGHSISTTDSIGYSTIDTSNSTRRINDPSTKGNLNNQIFYWIQLINQSAFELFTYIEYYSFRCSTANHHSPFLWPPPENTQERLVTLWFNQLSCFGPSNATTEFYHEISCWLRSFDLYLLSPYRFKWNVDISTRLFVSPVIIFLAQLFHQFATNNSIDSDKSLSKREHFLTGRCAGLLTTVLTRELLRPTEQKTGSERNLIDVDDVSVSMDVEFSSHGMEYNEMWLWDKLRSYLSDEIIKSPHGSVFPTLINYLVQFSLNQSPRICYAPPLTEETLNIVRNQYPSCNISIGNLKEIQIVDSTWTACLLQLYHVKYSLAVKYVRENKELCTKLHLTETYLDNLTPLSVLNEKLNVQYDTQLLKNQTGWLVPGFLPRITDGRYACPVFWRPLKDNRNKILPLL